MRLGVLELWVLVVLARVLALILVLVQAPVRARTRGMTVIEEMVGSPAIARQQTMVG